MKLRTHTEWGFTLIEVMVSLAIMALIATVAFAGLSIGLDTWKRGSGKIEQMDDRASVERLLKRQLPVAYPMQFQTDWNEAAFVMFRGTATRLEFIADYSVIDGQSDYRKIAYAFDQDGFRYQEKNLLGYVPSADEPVEGDRLAALEDGGFRYLLRTPSDEWSWAEDWALGDGIPAAVEVRFEGDVIVIPMVNR